MNAKRVSNNVLISTNDVCMLAPMSSTNFLPTLLFKEFKSTVGCIGKNVYKIFQLISSGTRQGGDNAIYLLRVTWDKTDKSNSKPIIINDEKANDKSGKKDNELYKI